MGSQAASYNDAGELTTQTYPDGDVLTTSYDPASGWATGERVQLSGAQTTTPLLASESYNALGRLTGASLGAFSGGSGAYSASYDLLGRVTSSQDAYTPTGGSAATLYSAAPTYDALGNVIESVTTLPTGVDTQVFCYDDLSRLTWAGSSGTPACSGAPTPSDTGSLAGTSASYSASYAYDPLNRLTSSPLGSYTYGDSSHVDAATAIGSGSGATWSASYDAAGDMTCRAASSATTCAGSSPTGAPMRYDNEGRLASWQNTPGSSPTESASYLYDGEGQRVQQVVTASGATTTTSYIGNLEEVTQSGSTTTTTAYYGSLAESVNGTLSYLLSDGLGSVSEAVSTAGSVSATQLYGPYGGVRYQSGTLPTDKGYTGQRSDASTSGLDYYGARYYDPVAGQFISADTTLAGGLNRYAYVAGNPETKADPTGHAYTCPTGACGPSAGGDPTAPANPTNPTPTLPTSKESGGAAAGSGTGANGSGSAESRTNNLTTKGACDPQCQRDTQLILNYLELKRNQNHLGADILALLADTAIAIVDYATQSWVSFVTDVVTFIVQAGQVGKDIAILHGASAQSLVGLNQVLSVMQGIVVAMNAALAVGWLAMLANGPGGLVSGGFKEGVKFILGTFGSMTQVAGAWSGMTDDAIDAQEAQLESASPQQRHQVCLSMKISGC